MTRPDAGAAQVVVVGLGVVTPQAGSPQELWETLRRPALVTGEPVRFDIAPMYAADPQAKDRTFSRAAGYIRDFRPHPALAAERDRGRWAETDAEVTWLRHSLLQALDTVTIGPAQRPGWYVAGWMGSVFAVEDALLVSAAARGVAACLAATAAEQAVQEERLLGLLRQRYRHAAARPREVLPDRLVRRAMGGVLAEDTDWLTVSTACSSGLYAIDLGVQSLLAGDCDVAFCGAVHGMGRAMALASAKFQGLSRAGDLRAFDAAADGTLFAEAAAVVALKRLEDAVADGDEILAHVAGRGAAADGRGKAIVAPNPRGERQAIERAWRRPDASAHEVDWVVAHGTGTPAGDQVEIEALSALSAGRRLACTSNKSVLGHTGWAAGAVSAIHAVLGLQHELIPAQQRFTTPHPALADSPLRVPTTDTPWPAREDRSRRVGVSSFGIGGSNAHLLLQDRAPEPAHSPVPPPPSDPVVLTAWSAWLPGRPESGQIQDWLATGRPAPAPSFGATYPHPPFDVTRLPPVITSAVDHSHLMALDVAHRFVTEHGELWSQHRDTTGVIAARTGPTQGWTDVVVRAASGDLESLGLPEGDTAALAAFLTEVRTRQPVNEETLAGSTPDLAAFRITNRWDLHGPTMAVDTGPSSAHTALHVAARHLTDGRLDLALVLALGASRTPEAAEFTQHNLERMAEGAFLLALTRESLAREQGWPVLARIATTTRTGTAAPEPTPGATTRTYLGADGALDVLRAAHRTGPSEISSAHPRLTIMVTPATTDESDDPARPDTSGDLSSDAVTRWATILRRRDAEPGGDLGEAVPRKGVMLVDSADTAVALAEQVRAQGAVMYSTDPATPPSAATVIDDIPGEEAMGPALDALDRAVADVRVIASVHEAASRWPAASPELTRLLELSLLTVKRLGQRTQTGTVAMLLQDPLLDGQAHPYTALFTGFTRTLAHELGQARTVTVVTDAPLPQALSQLDAETRALRDRPIVYYRGGLRHVEQLCPLPLPPGDVEPVLGDEPVIVAVGGARGITAVALEALAKHGRPTVWLLGSTDMAGVPEKILNATSAQQAALRREFISRHRHSDPSLTVGDWNRRFERQWRAREVARTLDRLRAICGDDRVHYLTCDVTNPTSVVRAAAKIRATTRRIDLLIHAANRQHSAPVTGKSLAHFRQTLGTKVAGYHHLRAAFADLNPRLWCNFGSALAVMGFPGECDYVAGNDFLAAAARYGTRLRGLHERTIGWGLWEETGTVSGPLDKASLGRAGITTGLRDTEGADLFLTELAHPRTAEPAPLYASPRDCRQILGHHPDFVPLPSDPPDKPALLGEPDTAQDGYAQWTWSVDPVRDCYLLEHLVDGRPVLPGMCILALAVEAAAHLAPDSTGPYSLRDVRFEEFVWADPRKPGPTKYRVVAEADVPGTPPGTVRVRILSDVVTPSGTVLRRDREHARADVLTKPQNTTPARHNWQATHRECDEDAVRHADPYCTGQSPIHLSGPFHNTTDITPGRDGGHGRWQPIGAQQEPIAHAPIPVLLLDALGRAVSFRPDSSGHISIRAPRRIQRIDIYEQGSDTHFAARYPAGVDLHCDADITTCTATAPDGHVLIRMSGLDCPVLATAPAAPLAPRQRDTPPPKTRTRPIARPPRPRPADPAAGLPTFEIEHLVTVGDTSSIGPVYYSKLIDWQGTCREAFGHRYMPDYMRDLDGEVTMVTHSCSCEYLKDLWLGDRVAIRMAVPWARMQYMQGLFFYYRITDAGEELIARGEQIWRSARRKGDTFESGPWPPEFLDTSHRLLGTDISRALVE